jgi:hypothetical protein
MLLPARSSTLCFACLATSGNRLLFCFRTVQLTMTFPPRSLPNLAPAYQPELDLPHTTYYNAPPQQLYGSYGVDHTSAFAVQAQRSGGPVATTPNHSLHPFTLPIWQPSHDHLKSVPASNSQPASASTAIAGPTSSMRPPDRPRKRKAATLRADDWEPYKKRILDLHIEQRLALPKVRDMIEVEYGFKAEYVTILRAN